MSWAAINWDAVTAIGQMIGALGVIVSLIYLALQVRADARARRAQTLHDLATAISSYAQSIVENEDVAELWTRGLERLDSLNTVEFVRFNFMATRLFRTHEEAYQQHRLGHLPLPLWQDCFENVLDRQLSFPGLRSWLQGGARNAYSVKFRELLDAKLAENRPPQALHFARAASPEGGQSGEGSQT